MAITLDRIYDIDSHEMIPFPKWPEYFGQAAELFAPLMQETSVLMEPGIELGSNLEDNADITADTVWNVKGAGAPGAIDLSRRLSVMDAMGVERQLVYPTMGLAGMQIAIASREFIEWRYRVKVPSGFDLKAVGRAMMREHNDWVMRNMKDFGGDRIRPVAVILTDDIDEMVAEAERVISGGARALFIPSSHPPGGRSPADRALDPLWQLAEETNVPVTLHLGGDFGFMKSDAWGQIPDFAPPDNYASIEFPTLDPYFGASVHYSNENFLQAIVLGGVFERHPQLRFGVIETGAIWLGPLAERLDKWAEVFPVRAARTMSMRPSEYLVRNVRVTPFYFEDVDQYVRRWPHLLDVYCFSSDYPHREGGKDTKAVHYGRLRSSGDDVLEKFFMKNAELLLPD